MYTEKTKLYFANGINNHIGNLKLKNELKMKLFEFYILLELKIKSDIENKIIFNNENSKANILNAN